LGRDEARSRAAGQPTGKQEKNRLQRRRGRDGYSRFVGFMKFILPAVAVALILLIIVWPRFENDDQSFRLGIAELAGELTKNSMMLNPRFAGVDENGRPFNVTAENASQEQYGADGIDLAQPRADMEMKDGAWLALAAETGRYLRESGKLSLRGNVSLFHDQGFEVRSESANVDLNAGSANGQQQVEAQGPQGTVVGEGFRIENRGAVIQFTGKSRLVIYPDTLKELK
jgi:lipopolysaccharide export system protein LptC|tara:strand:- start:377 stop:1060 length:684 start_codon:yes stop_codon:yes gene_type:complete